MFRSAVAFVLVALLLFSPVVNAAQLPLVSNHTSIAIVPLSDGDADALSQEVSGALGDAFRIASPYRIIDAEIASRIMTYDKGPVSISDSLNEAQTHLAHAKECYFKFQSSEAMKEISNAINILSIRPEDISQTGATLADAYVTQAVITRSKGDLLASRTSLEEAFKIDPLLELSTAQYPPSITSLFEDVKRSRSGLAYGTVSISTTPEAADVFVNGIQRGISPTALKLPEGDYRILVQANRYMPVEREVHIVSDVSVKVHSRLHWIKDVSRKVAVSDAASQVREGLRIAELMKVDKVILVDADFEGSMRRIETRMVDRKLSAGQPPVRVTLKGEGGPSSSELAFLTRELAGQVSLDIVANPEKAIEPKGIGTAALLENRRRPLLKNPWFWGLVGILAAAGIGGGLAAAMSGSGDVGALRVQFR